MSSMPFQLNELQQRGFVLVPTNPLVTVSNTNPYTVIPANAWIKIVKQLPPQLTQLIRLKARWGSISQLTDSPLQRTLRLMAKRLNVTEFELQKVFPVSTRQTVVLAGVSPVGLHIHPGVEFACKVADATFVPLCWPIMAVQMIIGKPPSSGQILVCLIQTALLEAFKQWCAGTDDDGGSKIGSPNPYFYLPGR